MNKKISSALISVYHKDGLEPLLRKMHTLGISLISTGGTASFIRSLALPVTEVQSLTQFPEIFGGRVKTLHPAIMGGILYRRNHPQDETEKQNLHIPSIDLVLVDLYPFSETLRAKPDNQEEIIEKIDIGGISLIRASAKNFHDVVIIPSKNEYPVLEKILNEQNGETPLEQRKFLAGRAFQVSSAYDAVIHSWFEDAVFPLRYGENPHQKGTFHGKLHSFAVKKSGKELSYNNLLDLDAAVALLEDLNASLAGCVIVKHNNPCGVALRKTPEETWEAALSSDPVSAFGGIIALNRPVSASLAQKIHELFFEVLIAPEFSPEALELLKTKTQRILLERGPAPFNQEILRTALNGTLHQDRDCEVPDPASWKVVTQSPPSEKEIPDLVFAQTVVKHSKSNAIVLAKNLHLLGIGTGQTSRIDALAQAIEKAKKFGFDLKGAVMASDAFFPFPDCVEMAYNAGISAVIQPGGSIRDKESIDFCNHHRMSMVFTGVRHFKH